MKMLSFSGNNSHVPNNSERATSQAPLAPPAPPPPPPPILNGGNIPTIRLRSEVGKYTKI